MNVKDAFFKRGSLNIGDGKVTRFWEDNWLGGFSLASQYPSLYNFVHHRHVTVASVLSQTPLAMSFRRTLTGNNWLSWIHLC